MITTDYLVPIKTLYLQLKSAPCTDCGGVFDPVCMEFDHLPQFTKVRNVSQMISQQAPRETVLKEIAKCELVCSNCHAIRTRDRAEAYPFKVCLVAGCEVKSRRNGRCQSHNRRNFLYGDC